MRGVSVDLFVSVLNTISKNFEERSLSTDVHADDLNALKDALARMETRAKDKG